MGRFKSFCDDDSVSGRGCLLFVKMVLYDEKVECGVIFEDDVSLRLLGLVVCFMGLELLFEVIFFFFKY